MASCGETIKSPWEQVWKQFVPQGHDQALRNAFYNVAAGVFIAVAAAAAWSVYLIFQPFLQSLLWAVLFGSVLHPVKHRVTIWVRGWLHQVQESGSLLSISSAILPLSFVDSLSEMIGWFIVAHMKGVVAVTVVLPLIYIVIHHTPTAFTSLAYTLLTTTLHVIKFVVTTVTSYHTAVLALVVIYAVAVLFFWTPETKHILRKLTIPFWILFAAAIAGLCPSLSVVIFIVLCLLLVAGLATEVLDVHAESKEKDGEDVSVFYSIVKVCLGDIDSPKKAAAITPSDETDSRREYTPSLESVIEEDDLEKPDEQENKSKDNEKLESSEEINNETKKSDETDSMTNKTDDFNNTLPENKDKIEEIKMETPAKKSNYTDLCQTPGTPNRPRSLGTPAFSSPLLSTPRLNLNVSKDDTEQGGSLIYIKGVFIACVLVELWQHNYLLPLLPMAMIYYAIKKMTSSYFSSGAAYNVAKGGLDHLFSSFYTWAETRKSVFLPLPMRGVVKLFVRTDGSLVNILLASVDVVVTILLMMGVLIFMTTTSLFLAVQVQGESMHMVTMGSQVINSTVVNNPQFHEMLPEGIDDVVQSTLDNAYVYGREYISGMVREMLGETDEAKAAALVKQVEELWDRVYQAWVAAHPQAPARGPVVTSEAVALTVDSLIDGIRKTPGLVSMSFLTEVIRENLGTVVSVLESVWHILLSNLSLCISTLTAASSLLLGGSLSILNALINVVVFMSSLFYILSTSGAVYKPVAMLSNLAPGPMNKLGLAVEQAINGVFTASFKMGAFYGMWTWLLHSLFGTNIVYIPSVLGALFGAVPLVGTYWAALPGVLELWWGHGSPSLAALLLIAQILPLSCVDTAIYGDINGGVHPYLTGLAVAGGVFCWGVEGAIFGPLVLCILLVATNMYASLIQGPSDLTRKFQKLRRVSAVT